MKTNEELMKAVAVNVLANPRANRTAARLATAYLEVMAVRERVRRWLGEVEFRGGACAVCTSVEGEPHHERCPMKVLKEVLDAA